VAEFLFSAAEFLANLAGLSRKELVTLTGEQLNASKFSYRLILKGIRQMLWHPYLF
jgi:hypothetical protein